MAKAKRSGAGEIWGTRKIALSPIDVILGEAASGTPDARYSDMLGISGVIMNRARQLGVAPEQVVAVDRKYRDQKGRMRLKKEFDAYGKWLPEGVERYRGLAERAFREVQSLGHARSGDGHEGISHATFYATPANTPNLPRHLRELGQTTGHRYFDDPANRKIETAIGYLAPDPTKDISAIYFTPLYNLPTSVIPGGPTQDPSRPLVGGLMAPNFGAGWMTAPGPVGYPPALSPHHVVPRISANKLLDRTGYLSSPARQSYAFDFGEESYGGPDPRPMPRGLMGAHLRRQRPAR